MIDFTYRNLVRVVPRVQGVVYCTWSTTNTENETLVADCIEEVNSSSQAKNSFNMSPPVLPLFVTDVDSATAPLIGKALHFQPSSSRVRFGLGFGLELGHFQPSSRNCGCFIANVTREVNTHGEQLTVVEFLINLNFNRF